MADLYTPIDWAALWETMSNRFTLGMDSIHGPAHWRRVEQCGIQLVEHSDADLLVVRLFAVFHDVCRQNDSRDDEHGARGAALAVLLRGEQFTLADDSLALLRYACTWHTSGQVHHDPTIGACWDADRLDLWRAGITPRESFMSTAYGRQLVRAGQIGPHYLSDAHDCA
jgi:uncharacterized protein